METQTELIHGLQKRSLTSAEQVVQKRDQIRSRMETEDPKALLNELCEEIDKLK